MAKEVKKVKETDVDFHGRVHITVHKTVNRVIIHRGNKDILIEF